MTSDSKQNELGTFLKARRAELTPRSAGLPDGTGPRRVAGLRREEVAQLASISTDYYTRIEQGRIHASIPVLSILAEVLQLDEDQQRYLFTLAGRPQTRTRGHGQATQNVKPQLQRLLDDLEATPAVVMSWRMDVLAWNQLAAAMITDFAAIPAKKRNYVRILFTDPAMRTLYQDWEQAAKTAVAQLRMAAARYPDDARLASLVGELSVKDEQFATWWEARNVATVSSGTKTMVHPVVGELVLEWDTLVEEDDAAQKMVVWTAAPGSVTRAALRKLAGLEGLV